MLLSNRDGMNDGGINVVQSCTKSCSWHGFSSFSPLFPSCHISLALLSSSHSCRSDWWDLQSLKTAPQPSRQTESIYNLRMCQRLREIPLIPSFLLTWTRSSAFFNPAMLWRLTCPSLPLGMDPVSWSCWLWPPPRHSATTFFPPSGYTFGATSHPLFPIKVVHSTANLMTEMTLISQ